jgi:cytidylate kinase
MRIITINGESKVCKTTVGEIIAERMGGATADAGQFFRGLTVDTFVELGVEAVMGPNPQLDAAVRRAIASGRAFELSDRGDLYRPTVEKMVSVVSKRPGAQQSGLEWYGRTLDNALASHVGALVLNGRNPNERLRDPLIRTAQAVDLSLLVDCDPSVAAERVLTHKARKQGLAQPTKAEIDSMRNEIVFRRELDRGRDDFPFEFPGTLVHYEPGTTDPHYAVARALETGSAVTPTEIYFDTTHLDFETMTEHADLLADAAMAQATA